MLFLKGKALTAVTICGSYRHKNNSEKAEGNKRMSNIKLFQDKKVRSHWDGEKNEWYFSVVDVCGILAESDNPRDYWKVLKFRLNKEGSELVTNCNQLKLQAADGKYYNTDVLDTKGVLRLIQSIPSPNAEPFKMCNISNLKNAV
jgi:hypothetical protein